jgi:hypothetical protein
MFEIIVSTVVIIIVCVALMSIRVILKKDGLFSSAHVGDSKALRNKRIYCAHTQDRIAAGKKNLFERIVE